jgi:hypothetical protein
MRTISTESEILIYQHGVDLKPVIGQIPTLVLSTLDLFKPLRHFFLMNLGPTTYIDTQTNANVSFLILEAARVSASGGTCDDS